VQGHKDGGEQHLVVVRLDRERYGVPIEHVHEIIRMQEVTRVPRAPSFVEGGHQPAGGR
jgi:purine-binding chemotaxis protein CheW